MGRKSKEKYAHLRKKDRGETPTDYSNPMENEVGDDGKFIFGAAVNVFRGLPLPSHFDINVFEDDELEEGQVIGTSRLGQVLYWIYNSVVAKG